MSLIAAAIVLAVGLAVIGVLDIIDTMRVREWKRRRLKEIADFYGER